ncbi:hypothetical protein [Cyclobacterium sediminis]
MASNFVRSLFLLFFLPFSGMAQDIIFGIETKYNFPINDFKEKIQANSFPEIAGSVYYEFPSLPVAAGLSVGYGIYGSSLEKRDDLYNGDSEVLRLRRNSNILNIKAHYKHYLPWVKMDRLFIDAQIGLSNLYTRYMIRETIFSEILEEGLDHSAFTMAYGLALGYKLPIEFKGNDTQLELKVNYNSSVPFRFLPKGAVETTKSPGENAVFHYNTQRSSLEIVQIAIAVVGI